MTGRSTDIKLHGFRAKNIIQGLITLAAIVLVGTLGYMVIERWRILDALYMTVITITTVGYGEIRKVSEAGRIFTIILIFLGIGNMGYIMGMVAQAMVEFQLKSILGRRKLGLKIRSLKDHYIICGYGRIGKIISQELMSHKIPMLVVEGAPELQNALEQNGVPYIIGDATDEDLLVEAGIARAKGLVAVVLSDADNLFITMTARSLNPDLFILARAEEEPTRKKLLRAGANRVVLPYLIGGQRMAHSIIKPAVMDFFELTIQDKSIELEMEELFVDRKSSLNGVTLVDSGIRQEMNVIVVAIRKSRGEMVFNPSSETRIETGDTLIALGHMTDLKRLATILSGK